MAKSLARRYDLDWLRVLLFGLLVPYHAAIGFVSYGHNVYGYRNPEVAGNWLEMLIFFSHTWRLPALFMISGVGSWFLLRHGNQAFLENRVMRLLVPLFFAMVIWNAPHGYFLKLVSGGELGGIACYKQWLLDFGLGHARHLWFLINLFVYGLLLMAAVPLLRLLQSVGIVRLALALLASTLLIDLLLKPLSFERPLDYRDFWYVPFFFAGYVAMMQDEVFWRRLSALRWTLLILGLVISLAFIPIYGAISPKDAPKMATGGWLAEGWPYQTALTFIHSIAYNANAVIWCGVVFGFAHHNLNVPSRILERLNRAVYPVFIFHFPIMMVGLYYLRQTAWPWALEIVVLILGTFALSYFAYWALDQSRIMRRLIGISPERPAISS